MAERKFFICKHCGNIVGMIVNGQAPMTCCGEVMQELVPNTVDAAHEKHIPVIEVEDKLVHVKVSSVEHPMIKEHLIQWIYLETTKGGQRKSLQAGDSPKVSFALTADDKPLAAYAYCNLHGLWLKKL